MSHGVCPPLTAMLNWPRAALAARASAAIIAAAFLATDSASARTSTFMPVSHLELESFHPRSRVRQSCDCPCCRSRSLAFRSGFLQVTTKLKTHRREELVGKVRFATRAESLV